MVMEVVQEDMGSEGNIQCTNHPYKNNTPGGICAFCLQEKLGKLVSSSFPITIFPSSSASSSPPSFRSDFTTTTSSLQIYSNTSSSSNPHTTTTTIHKNGTHYRDLYYPRKSRMAFLLAQKKKKKKDVIVSGSDQTNPLFKRSKSTTTSRQHGLHSTTTSRQHGLHFMETDAESENRSPYKRGFWSFLNLSKHSTTKKITSNTMATSSNVGSFPHPKLEHKNKQDCVIVDKNDSPNGSSSFDRKVSRSRSVGCGSRSFSGDFFERISTGFGDCTLRRVESQREGKPKGSTVNRRGSHVGQERVKCGGIFSGFMIPSSSSSSSSSSYWVSSSAEDNVNAKTQKIMVGSREGQLVHGRNKSWGWALASPIRAFSGNGNDKPSSLKREAAADAAAADKNVTPNLAAIPSLLAAGG